MLILMIDADQNVKMVKMIDLISENHDNQYNQRSICF